MASRQTRSKTREQKDEYETKTTWGSGGLFANREFFSLAFVVLCPIFLLFMWYIFAEHKGSLLATYNAIQSRGVSTWFVREFYPKVQPFDPEAWKMIAVYSAFELLFASKVSLPQIRLMSKLTPLK